MSFLHEMKLYEIFYNKLKNNEKHFEIRLNDEKRKRIKTGDLIKFNKYLDEKESVYVKVLNIYYYQSFYDLFKKVPLKLIGFENESIESGIKEIYSIYTEEEEKKWGVVLFEVELTNLKNNKRMSKLLLNKK